MPEPVPTETPNVGPSPATRKWIYGIVVAGLALAVYFKFLPEDSLPLWVDLAANILGIGALSLATANVPRRPQ